MNEQMFSSIKYVLNLFYIINIYDYVNYHFDYINDNPLLFIVLHSTKRVQGSKIFTKISLRPP